MMKTGISLVVAMLAVGCATGAMRERATTGEAVQTAALSTETLRFRELEVELVDGRWQRLSQPVQVRRFADGRIVLHDQRRVIDVNVEQIASARVIDPRLEEPEVHFVTGSRTGGYRRTATGGDQGAAVVFEAVGQVLWGVLSLASN